MEEYKRRAGGAAGGRGADADGVPPPLGDPRRAPGCWAQLPDGGRSAELVRTLEGLADCDLYDVLADLAYGWPRAPAPSAPTPSPTSTPAGSRRCPARRRSIGAGAPVRAAAPTRWRTPTLRDARCGARGRAGGAGTAASPPMCCARPRRGCSPREAGGWRHARGRGWRLKPRLRAACGPPQDPPSRVRMRLSLGPTQVGLVAVGREARFQPPAECGGVGIGYG